MDCGPTCIKIIAKFYGKDVDLRSIREQSYITRDGVSLLGISDAAKKIGFRTDAVEISFNELIETKRFPCILHWNTNHFVVCYGALESKKHDYLLKISDPVGEKYKIDKLSFLESWAISGKNGDYKGYAILLDLTPDFYNKNINRKNSLSFLMNYLIPYKFKVFQLFAYLCVSSLFAFLLPFLTQQIVDKGVSEKKLNLITLILIAQLLIFIIQLIVEYMRNWITLHINIKISISIVSDFLIKLMKLPLSFFDSKNVGDIMQRIEDNDRIKMFLTGSTLMTLFSLINFIVFSIILAYYKFTILIIFCIGNMIYILWILLFLKYRRKLDIIRFKAESSEQNSLFQLVTGIQEIKLNNCEKQEKNKWEKNQYKLFQVSLKSLRLGQYQQLGSVFFSQTTYLLISFIAAKNVIIGDMTLGMMFSISYIIGQLSVPINQLIRFTQEAQDAKISLERLGEIQEEEDEDSNIEEKALNLPSNKTIKFNNVSFSYNGDKRNYILHNINLVIPEGKITAIVGASGSGKTTLIKLILGFYSPTIGSIMIGDKNLHNIKPSVWRDNIGAVMQDGFIFSDSIAKNIAVGEGQIDYDKIIYASKAAQIDNYINSLPHKYKTKIGLEGNTLSQGQKQRILIARAIYKNPYFIFLDEATNALDTTNERRILEKLNDFYRGKTVVIVAHRLSTVQMADNIIVIDNGIIVEEGNHNILSNKRGIYYNLVKNQLELGN